MKKKSFLQIVMFVCFLLLAGISSVEAQPGAGMGRVIVALTDSSDVASAQVFINGEAKGSVRRGQEVQHVVPFGSGREATIEVRSGEFSEQQKVVLYANRWTRVTFTLRTVRPGNIAVTHAAGSFGATAQVHINNNRVGNLRRGQTQTFTGYNPGEYTVRITAGNRQAESRVTVRPNQTSRVTLTIEPPPGVLEVTYDRNSHFATADVFVNNVRRGQIRRGQTWTDSGMQAGTYTVRLQSGSESIEERVTIRAGATSRVTLRLDQPMGTLRITYDRNSAYTTAQLYLDNQLQGTVRRGEVKVFQLRPGTYNVRVEHGSEGQMRDLSVRSGETTEALFTLRGLSR